MGENPKRYKIAYYTINDPHDKRSWSGITYYMGQTLKKHIGDVDFLGPVRIPWFLDKTFRAIQKLSRYLFRSEWIPKYSLLKNIYAARVLQGKMNGLSYDFLVAPAAASELAYLNTNVPIIYYGDATYKLYSAAYEKEFSNQGIISWWEGNHLERKALKKSDLVLFSSQWAANSAINDYGVPAKKIEVIQLGANIDQTPEYEAIFEKEQNETLTMLFLSVDWDRKGGPIAFKTLEHLHRSGRPVKLIVCGCTPPREYRHPEMEVIAFLNKNEPEDFKRFADLLRSAHFLLLPTRADCTPLVNCEANAYGIPVVTTDVGGITQAIKNGINGYCLPFHADGEEYAHIISELYSDKDKFHRLIVTSRNMYDKELNWAKFADNFRNALKRHDL